MKYATDEDILTFKKEEQIKLKQHSGHLPLIIGIGLLAFLFFCVLPYFIPRGDPAATPTPAAIAAPMLNTVVPPASPFPTATASPAPLPTWTMWPTETRPVAPVAPAPMAATAAIPATYTPPPTHTAAPTYTPPPTWTPPATWTPAPTWTPQATQTAQNTPLPLIVTRNILVPVPAEEPFPIAGLGLLPAGLLALLLFGLWLLRRNPVQPAPIIIQQAPAPAALPSPTPRLEPLILRRNEQPAPVSPVQTPPEVAPVSPVKTPVQNGHEVGGNGNRPGPGRITVSVEPAEPIEVDEALNRRICAAWNSLKDPSNNKVIDIIWGGKNKKNSDRNALVNRAIEWGRGQGIVKDEVSA